ncbi:DMT family transporter [Paenibacillus pini]|uniref:Membrane protein n=1 Tax=Paenibacillus pini JCM 16418 TaxID=1236976 RepID=W7Z065_9BACL|nr:DMT family transporter [Paenibacillus pini]GAF10351.1 membrane protein [Paenibacillus pini JCM 16418]
MKGIIFALLGGAFITLQGVANARISQDIGTWQAATITQLTGFIVAFIILMFVKERGEWKKFKQVNPLYMLGGAFAAIIIFSNVTAIQHIGVTLSISAIMIAQLSITFIIDINGWFGLDRKKMRAPQFIGIGLMIAGVVILGF